MSAQIELLPLTDAKEIWESFLTPDDPLPMLSYEWFCTWYSINTKWKPYLLLVKGKALAPFVRKGNEVQLIHTFTDVNDIIGSKNAWGDIIEWLKADGITNIAFENIPAFSETRIFFERLASLTNNRFQVHPTKTSPYLSLPNSFESYLSSIGSKRKVFQRFQRDYPMAQLVESNDLEKDVENLIALMKTNPIKKASFTPEKEAFFTKIVKACKDNSKILSIIINDSVAAIRLMFVHNTTVRLYISGYDRDRYSNVGTYFFIMAIKYAIENGYKEVDFLTGAEPYKYDLGARDAFLFSIEGNL